MYLPSLYKDSSKENKKVQPQSQKILKGYQISQHAGV